MVQLNFAWHIYMKAFCPSVRAMSFVDNLALAAAVPALLAQGLACLVEFFCLWNLVLDHNKSYCWALADDMRSAIAHFALHDGHLSEGAWRSPVIYSQAVYWTAGH